METKKPELCRKLKENHASKDRQNSRPQEGHGHDQEHRLPQVRQADPDREAREGPRAQYPGRNFYLVLGLRVLREAVVDFLCGSSSVHLRVLCGEGF